MTKRILNFVMWIVGFIILIFLLSQLFLFTKNLGYDIFSNQANDSKDQAVESAITIRENESLLEIGRDLKNKGIVRDAYLFAISAWTMDDHDKIVPGECNITSAQKPSELVETFTGEMDEDEIPDLVP